MSPNKRSKVQEPEPDPRVAEVGTNWLSEFGLSTLVLVISVLVFLFLVMLTSNVKAKGG